MPTRVAVVGAGSWGTAMAAMLARRVATVLWARRPELAAEMRRLRANPDYLPATRLPPSLAVTSALVEAADGADVVVMAVPSHGMRAVFARLVPHLGPGVPVVSLTKGLEEGTRRRMTEVMAALAPGRPLGVLTGPTLVGQVVAGEPAAGVLAMEEAGMARELQALFTTEAFRVYTNPDVVGCELAGALKNVVAIAAGMADGLGFGDNTKAALVTRGLAELARLGVALGGEPLTFSGLAGMGDLVATCTSRASRNRWVGEHLGRGRPLAEILAGTRMVAEGVRTAGEAVDLAAGAGVDVPIAEQVAAVLAGAIPASAAVPALMLREAKDELHGMPVGPAPGLAG